MLKYLVVSILLMISVGLNAQENLVPNGHFDENPSQYNGGNDPVSYYSAGADCGEGRDRFEADITSWKVARSDADQSDLQNFHRRCSPDWIAGYAYDIGTSCNAPQSSFYVASGLNTESIMVELKNGYTLIKGKTYKFRIKVRSARGSGNFQLVFSKDDEGLRVQPHKKWVAGDFYLSLDCEWKNIEYYFTVPNDNQKDYEDMKYLVLQYNSEQIFDQYGEKVALHYDDVFLAEGEQCEDIKYIQDWQYFEDYKIVQANVKIIAGEDVSPYAWDEIGPVIVKSGSAVIYRAPVVVVDNTFIVEPGAYWETQIGTCVPDPCPNIYQYDPDPITACAGEITLGQDIVHAPGVFYDWQPHEYFSNPWSNITGFTPPSGTGCVDASLTIWTICGPSQQFSFPISYFDVAPTITFSNVVSTANQFNFDLNVLDATEYTVQAFNTATNSIVYENSGIIECNSNGNIETLNLNFDPCTDNMCGTINVTVTATNDCLGTVTEVLTWTSPPPVPPTVQIANNVANDYDYYFDVINIPQEFEYLQIEVTKVGQATPDCIETIYSCDDPNMTSYHFDITQCLAGCLSQCDNYVITVKVKNVCYPTLATQVLYWNKSNPTFTLPTVFPNVITPNGDNINDELCFNLQGADWYSIWIVNRWQVTVFESSGCVNSNPICVWGLNTNLVDGTYFYNIDFGNACGASGSHLDFVQLVDGGNRIANPDIENSSENSERDDSKIEIFPNPTYNDVVIKSTELIKSIQVFNSFGALLEKRRPESKECVIELEQIGSGVYSIEIITTNGVEIKKVVVF